jgi:hypothetical protein
MKKANNDRSVFYLNYDDGTDFVSKPCEWLSEAMVQAGRPYPPTSAAFDWGGILTPCTPMGIIRAMQEASDRIVTNALRAA